MTLENGVQVELADKIILVAEVAIDGPGRDLGFLGNHGDGEAVEALLAEDLVSRLEDAFFLIHGDQISVTE
ncbi:hypothetical protein D3C71_1668980 [compost metagenome]